MLVFDWAALALFSAGVLVVALYGLTVSGHFPAESREAGLQGRWNALLLWSTIVLAGLAAATLLAKAWAVLPWYATIIGAGAALLFAPLILRPFPDRFVNGRWALVLFSAGAAVLAWAVRA